MPGFFYTIAAQFFSALRVGYDLAMANLFPDPVNFQVAHNDMALAVDAKVNKRVRDERADGIEHIGVVLAVSNYQYVVRITHGRARRGRGDFHS